MKTLELCKGIDPLPPELLKNSVIVSPRDKLLGAAISELRSNGLVMTELDVRLKALGETKFSDLLKAENMGSVRDRRESEKIQIKKNGLAELSKISKFDSKTPSLIGEQVTIMHSYYKMRTNYSDISGLSYEGQLRIFKTKDVQNYYQDSSYGLADEMLISLDSYREYRLGQKLGQKKVDLEYQIDWMESGILADLFAGEIPASVGSDDARIARKIFMEYECLAYNEKLIVGIITNDIQLEKSLELLTQDMERLSIVRISVNDYIIDCFGVESKDSTHVLIPRIGDGKEIRGKRSTEMIRCGIKNWRDTKNYLYKILLDFPNINRMLEGMRKRGKNLFYFEGGFFRRDTARNCCGWSSMEYESFKNLEDFSRKVRPFERIRY